MTRSSVVSREVNYLLVFYSTLLTLPSSVPPLSPLGKLRIEKATLALSRSRNLATGSPYYCHIMLQWHYRLSQGQAWDLVAQTIKEKRRQWIGKGADSNLPVGKWALLGEKRGGRGSMQLQGPWPSHEVEEHGRHTHTPRKMIKVRNSGRDGHHGV